MAAAFEHSTLRNDANLQAYYKLEDVTDEVGANDLTNNNTVTFVTGKFGNGASMGSSVANKSLSIANAFGLNGLAPAACSFWVKANVAFSGGEEWAVLNWTETTNDSELFIDYFNNAGTPTVQFQRNTNVTTNENAVHTIPTNDFDHFVITYDGTNVVGYINNVEVVNFASTDNAGTVNLANLFKIGEDRSGNRDALLTYDDVAVFDRHLTADDVDAIFNAVEPVLVDGGDFKFL